MSGHEIVVVGGIFVEGVARAPRLPDPDESLEARSFRESLGGKGALQAVACARLGARVALVGKLGADERGDRALARLRAEGVDTRFVVRDDGAVTGARLKLVDAYGGSVEVSFSGANRGLRPSEIRRAHGAFRGARVVLSSLEIPLAALVAALELAAGSGGSVILDPSPAPAFALPTRVFHLTDLLLPGSREARALTGIGVHDRRGARLAGERLLWMGVPQVLVQGGNHGSLLLQDEREWWFPHSTAVEPADSPVVEATAAGIAIGLTERHSWASAALFGTAAGSLAGRGAGGVESLPARAAVLRQLGPRSAGAFASEHRAA